MFGSSDDRRQGAAGRVAAAATALGLVALVAATAIESGRRAPAPERIALDARVDLNRAEPWELAMLPGIGPRLAERIADDRMRRGPYASVADLDRVAGIGPRTVERVARHAKVEAPAGGR